MPFVSGPVTLVLGIFLLRHSGQALARHVAVTSMGRYFDRGRGRAIAIASLGQSAGEAVLPFLAVAAIAVVGWRWTYAGVAVILAITSFPTVRWLLRGYEELHAKHLEILRKKTDDVKSNVVSWTRKMVLRDVRFYLLLPAMVATPMIATAFFFHHLNIAEAKQWDARWITGNYLLYAGISMAAMLTAGSLIDRFSARRVIQYTMIPLALAALTIGIADHYLWVLPYMILLGLHVGFLHTSASALYAELYGVEYLGSIKSMVGVFAVLASAIGPVVVGVLLDRGITIQTTCILIATYVVVSNMLLLLALRIVPTVITQPNMQRKMSR
jgi:MFS family permease